jgi:hypothetical protein
VGWGVGLYSCRGYLFFQYLGGGCYLGSYSGRSALTICLRVIYCNKSGGIGSILHYLFQKLRLCGFCHGKKELFVNRIKFIELNQVNYCP